MPAWGKPARGPGDPGSAGEASEPSASSGPGARLLLAPSARAEGRGQNQGSSSLPALCQAHKGWGLKTSFLSQKCEFSHHLKCVGMNWSCTAIYVNPPKCLRHGRSLPKADWHFKLCEISSPQHSATTLLRVTKTIYCFKYVAPYIHIIVSLGHCTTSISLYWISHSLKIRTGLPVTQKDAHTRPLLAGAGFCCVHTSSCLGDFFILTSRCSFNRSLYVIPYFLVSS